VPFHRLNLTIVDDTFAVCRLEADASILPWATTGSFFSLTRTADELSVVCRQDAVPEGVVGERGWRCLRVAGSIPFSVVGFSPRWPLLWPRPGSVYSPYQPSTRTTCS
jgi:hypothetical protein